MIYERKGGHREHSGGQSVRDVGRWSNDGGRLAHVATRLTRPVTSLQYLLARLLPAKLKADHGRAIDRYIDYFGETAALGGERRARRSPSIGSLPLVAVLRALIR